MMEMHLGTKPGKPTRLLLVSAGLLGLVLTLAQTQSALRMHGTAALSEKPIAIGGTPLTVRLPHQAIAEDRQNRSFILPLPGAPQGPHREPAGRRVRFFFERRKGYISPQRLAHELGRDGPNSVATLDPVRIGSLPAADFLTALAGEQRGAMVVLRLACSPRGEVIGVEYTPLSDWTPAEQRVLDAICETITIEGASGAVDPGRLQSHAGLTFPVKAGWQLAAPEIAEVPGLYVSDVNSASGWAIGAVRTWISDADAAGRTLRDLAGSLWNDETVENPSGQRLKNGVDLYWIEPGRTGGSADLCGVGLVMGSPTEAAWLFASGDAAAAQAAVQEIAEIIRFEPVPVMHNLSDAETAAVDFVRNLEERGAQPWWRGVAQTRYLLFRSGRHYGGGILSRDAFAGGDSGYRGIEAYAFDDVPSRRQVDWQFSGTAYDFEFTEEQGTQNSVLRTSFKDSRRTNETEVRRVVGRGRRSVQQSIAVGPRFVPTPLEQLAEQSVALREHAALLIDVLSLERPRAISRLLRNLPPDAAGNRRVLCLDSQEPWGQVIAFDSSGEWAYQHSASAWLDAVPRDAAEAASPALRDLLRRQGLPER